MPHFVKVRLSDGYEGYVERDEIVSAPDRATREAGVGCSERLSSAGAPGSAVPVRCQRRRLTPPSSRCGCPPGGRSSPSRKEAAEPVRHGFRRSASKRRVPRDGRRLSRCARTAARYLVSAPAISPPLRRGSAEYYQNNRTWAGPSFSESASAPARVRRWICGGDETERRTPSVPGDRLLGQRPARRMAGWTSGSGSSGHHWLHLVAGSLSAADRRGGCGASPRGNRRQGKGLRVGTQCTGGASRRP